MSGAQDGRRHLHVPHEPYEWREPGPGPDTQQPKQSHAGNGTVNLGPDDRSSAELDPDELALRSMLHQAVQEIEPRDGTLDRLRKAVPARRARKRQALVGMAAAALFVGTAVPALWHVSNSAGLGADPSIAGHGSQSQGAAGEEKAPDGGESTSGGSAGKTEDKGGSARKPDGGDKPGGSTDGSGGGSGGGPSTSTVSAPVCTATELGSPTQTVDAPDSVSAVYGTFRFTNVSGASCTVDGPGTLNPTAQGAADPTRIGAVRHVAGDPAAALPDPALEVTSLVLKPGASYEVKFAWVPTESCPTTGDDSSGGTGDPTPDPTPSQDASTDGGTTTDGDTGPSTQLMTEEGTADGSVTVTSTADGGAPSVSATVSNACAGTVYWTGLLAGA